MKRYFVLFPGSAFAGNFYGRNKDEAKKAARKWINVSRLPNGTAIWEG